jgi:transcription elongation factor GreA
VGDVATVVTPNGKRELEVLKLTTIHDVVEKGISDADGVAG